MQLDPIILILNINGLHHQVTKIYFKQTFFVDETLPVYTETAEQQSLSLSHTA